MRSEIKQLILPIALVFAVAATARSAVMIVDAEDFAGGISGWNLTDDAGAAANGTLSAGIGNGAPGLQIDNSTLGPPPQVDRAFADGGSSGGVFAGNVDYTLVLGQPKTTFISLDFYTYQGSAPTTLQLFFTSSSTPLALWVVDLQPPAVAGWQTYTAYMTSSQWYDYNFSGGAFNSAIVDVDEIGIRFQYLTTANNQVIGIDNFRRGYAVPEPGTFAALGFAFASMGLTFRRRLNEAVAKIKGLIKK